MWLGMPQQLYYYATLLSVFALTCYYNVAWYASTTLPLCNTAKYICIKSLLYMAWHASIILQLCNTLKCICLNDLNYYYIMAWYASINSTIYAILLSAFALVIQIATNIWLGMPQ